MFDSCECVGTISRRSESHCGLEANTIEYLQKEALQLGILTCTNKHSMHAEMQNASVPLTYM